MRSAKQPPANKKQPEASVKGVALLPAAAAVGMARGGDWNYNDAINMNEGQKVFYLYRGVLIVLVVALPHCTNFLGLGLDALLLLEGDITEEQFDKAVWLICNAMTYLDPDRATTPELQSAYNAAVRIGRGSGFIKGFNDLETKQGGHAVIAKSISRIVIRFLFAFSLNLRGLGAANDIVVPVNAAAAGAGTGVDDDEAQITRAITEATAVLSNIQSQLPVILTELLNQYDQLGRDEAQKTQFIVRQFDPIIKHLNSLGDEFTARRDEILTDITGIIKPLTPASASERRDQAIRISPRTFQTRVNTLETFINRSMTGHIRELTGKLENMREAAETKLALDELLQSAGDTFKGLHPISRIVVDGGKQIHNGIFVRCLLKKALVMQENISKLLLTPVTIAYKPSIQEFLSRIGLLDSTAAVDDDDDDGNHNHNAHPLAKRLRRILEPVQAQSQCEQTIGKLSKNPSIRCYICGGVPTGVTMECEHIFCIGLAIEYFGLLRCSGLSREEKQFLSILYAWAHRCCNRLKSNISFMKVNPNYKAPQVQGEAQAAGRDNFFMFHQENASKLLGEIYNNNNQHDCKRIIDRRKTSKLQFVSSKVPVVSANVLPLVDVANTVFGSVFAASSVLLTAMSCFKNIASLLVIQAATVSTAAAGNQRQLTLNRDNMLDGFQSILPGVVAAAGGSRNKKNKYIGGMQRTNEDSRQTPLVVEPPPQVDMRDFLTDILDGLVLKQLELEQPILEELRFDTVRRTPIQEQPIQCENINPVRVTLAQNNSILPGQKYYFLFKLTSITHNLNPMCLYSQLLLANGDEAIQDSNINVFGTICDNYIQNNGGGEGIYTLNDLSVILLCQIAVDGLEGFNNVTDFNVVDYISSRSGHLLEDDPSDEFVKFSTDTTFIFDSMSRENWPGGSIRNHTGIIPEITNRLRDAFMKLCLLRLNRYTECYDTAYDLIRLNKLGMARNTVNDFIAGDLYSLYCPFDQNLDQSKEDSVLKRTRESATQRYTEQNETNLFKQANFQNYLTVKNTEYLNFFEFMVDYSNWNRACSREPVRYHNTKGHEDSAPSASASPSPQRTISAPAALGSTNQQGLSGYKTRALTTSDEPASQGGSSLKKNKHNNTKKYKHRIRKPAKSRRNKSNYKYKINYTIKRRKSRRNNRSYRK